MGGERVAAYGIDIYLVEECVSAVGYCLMPPQWGVELMMTDFCGRLESMEGSNHRHPLHCFEGQVPSSLIHMEDRGQPQWSSQIDFFTSSIFLSSCVFVVHPFRYPVPAHRYVANPNHPRYGAIHHADT